MRVAVRMVVRMSVCAAALIGSSWALNGSPAGPWVDAGLYLATGCFFASQLILQSVLDAGKLRRHTCGGLPVVIDTRGLCSAACAASASQLDLKNLHVSETVAGGREGLAEFPTLKAGIDRYHRLRSASASSATPPRKGSHTGSLSSRSSPAR